METVTFETIWDKSNHQSHFNSNLLEIYPRPFAGDPFPGAFDETSPGDKVPKNFDFTAPQSFEQDKWTGYFGKFISQDMKPAPDHTTPLLTYPSSDIYAVTCDAWAANLDG